MLTDYSQWTEQITVYFITQYIAVQCAFTYCKSTHVCTGWFILHITIPEMHHNNVSE